MAIGPMTNQMCSKLTLCNIGYVIKAFERHGAKAYFGIQSPIPEMWSTDVFFIRILRIYTTMTWILINFSIHFFQSFL